MKKVLLVTLEFPPIVGGIATYTHELISALEPSQVIVLALACKDTSWDKTQPYTIIRRPMFFPIWVWPRWARLVWHVWRIVKKEQIDILFVHHTLPAGYVGLIMKWFLHIPFLLFVHGTDITFGTRSRWKRWWFGAIASRAEAIVPSSVSLKEQFLAVFPGLPKPIEVVYPGLSSVFFEPIDEQKVEEIRDQYALSGKTIMLSVGRIHSGKGFLYLVRLLPTLVARFPNLVWVVVGTGKELPLLQKEIEKLGIENRVRLVGEAPHDTIRLWYALADLFVLLTHPVAKQKEGFGLVYIEAAAMGVPVVAGRGGGVNEAVIHGQTGLVVDAMNDKEVFEAISTLLANPEYAKKLGEAARARVEVEFQWNHQIEKLKVFLV
ncbi:MAG: glycosyltransferase family 4 protein [Patescibacteria group bacterium]